MYSASRSTSTRKSAIVISPPRVMTDRWKGRSSESLPRSEVEGRHDWPVIGSRRSLPPGGVVLDRGEVHSPVVTADAVPTSAWDTSRWSVSSPRPR